MKTALKILSLVAISVTATTAIAHSSSSLAPISDVHYYPQHNLLHVQGTLQSYCVDDPQVEVLKSNDNNDQPQLSLAVKTQIDQSKVCGQAARPFDITIDIRTLPLPVDQTVDLKILNALSTAPGSILIHLEQEAYSSGFETQAFSGQLVLLEDYVDLEDLPANFGILFANGDILPIQEMLAEDIASLDLGEYLHKQVSVEGVLLRHQIFSNSNFDNVFKNLAPPLLAITSISVN